MTAAVDTPAPPLAKRVAAGIVVVVLLTIAALVWFDSKDIPQEPAITTRKDAPPLLNFPFLDKADYDQKDGDLKVTYPPDMSALEGKQVAIAGFMTPFEKLDDMRQFLLMPSSGGCFFCQAPSLSQVVMVHQITGPGDTAKLPFVPEPILVTATLHLYSKDSKNPAHEAGFIFALDDAQVTKLTPAAAEVAGLVGAPPLVRR